MKMQSLCVIVMLSVVPTPVLCSNKRPGASRELGIDEILRKRCNMSFTVPVLPKDDYFRGSACSPQVHVSLGSSSSMVISFASGSLVTESKIVYGTDSKNLNLESFGVADAYTSLMSIDAALYAPSMGEPSASEEEILDMENTSAWASKDSTSYAKKKKGSTVATGIMSYKNVGAVYASPILHTVTLENLIPGTQYFYRLPFDDDDDSSLLSFAFPPSSYPLKLGLTADLGQTQVSNRSIHELRRLDADLVIIAGDLSYADGWPFRWDTFAALLEPLATVPLLTTGGNHEIGGSENWLHYLKRFPVPHRSSLSPSGLYYSVDVGDNVKIIALNSYDNFVDGGDKIQREWLLNDLADTPSHKWIIVVLHVPFYTSSLAHPKEAELMRQTYETIFYGHGVDLVIAGHVHAYERTLNVFDNKLDDCGPVHLDLGDGGNRENTNVDWKKQPEWSKFRESSFGVGSLTFESPTKATYEWRRDACGDGSRKTSKNSQGFDLNFETCETPHDMSGNPHATVDAVTLHRQSKKECRDKRRQAVLDKGFDLPRHFPALVRDDNDDPDNVAPEAAMKRQQKRTKNKKKPPTHSHLLGAFFTAIVSFALGALLTSFRCQRHNNRYTYSTIVELPKPENKYKLTNTLKEERSPLSITTIFEEV